MKKARLELIEQNMKNFKGFKDMSICFDGNDVEVVGGNGAGKTTIFDAFSWVLFGRDSKDSDKPGVKPLNKDGEVLEHGAETIVELIFRLDGKIMKLKRVFREKWTKKTGEREKRFTGHETKFYIDDVPKKEKEYAAHIEKLISDKAFKILTNPLYFSSILPWKERRKILMELAGGVTDDEIAASHKELKTFLERLDGKTIEDYTEQIKERRSFVVKELDSLPVRIDEILLTLPDEDSGLEQIAQEVKAVSDQIKAKQEKISSIRSGKEITEKQKQISDIELKASQLQNRHKQNADAEVYKIKERLQEAENKRNLTEQEIRFKRAEIERIKKRVAAIDTEVEVKRDEFRAVRSKRFNHENSCICPTCTQPLPQEQIEEAKANFNRNRAEQLEAIAEQANQRKQEAEQIKEEANQMHREAKELDKVLAEQTAAVKQIQSELDELKGQQLDMQYMQEYQALIDQKKQLQDEIKQINESTHEAILAVTAEIDELEQQKNQLQERASQFAGIERTKARVAELEQLEKEYSREFEQLEKDAYLMDLYTRRKVELLESKFNQHFQITKFKLFDEQVNGTRKETCEATFDGVPFTDGLNKAARINVGLDIIETLSGYFGISAPIFIDNSESVTDLRETDAQTITLTVRKIEGLAFQGAKIDKGEMIS